jgi:hypothetical protein
VSGGIVRSGRYLIVTVKSAFTGADQVSPYAMKNVL